MRFAYDDTHRTIAQVAAEVLDGTGTDLPDRSWKALGQAGMLSLGVPEWLGGEGLGVVETAVVLTEVGRRAVTVPAFATLALGVLPVARWGSRDQQRELLSGVAGGDTVLTAALREPSRPLPDAPDTVLSAEQTIWGTKVGVPYAEQAQRILVPVRRHGGGAAVALVDPSGAGVTLRRTPSSSGAPEYTVQLDGAPAAGLLGEGDGGGALDDLHRFAVAGVCALGDGILAGALALTAAYVGTRQQFGRPLAAFQAVAQQIADVSIAARTLHLAALSAAWRLGTDRSADGDLSVAAYWFATEAPAALRTCHHLHGGVGVDISYPLHRFSSLTKDLVRLLGGAEHCLDRLERADVD
jgi:3-oxo-4-pregnene-20-carboxyl-CoA dehydrogenase alpha subunit